MDAKNIQGDASRLPQMEELRIQQREELNYYRFVSKRQQLDNMRPSLRDFIEAYEIEQRCKSCDWLASVKGEWPKDDEEIETTTTPSIFDEDRFNSGVSPSPSPCPSEFSDSSGNSSVCSLDAIMSTEVSRTTSTDFRREYLRSQQSYPRPNLRRSIKAHGRKFNLRDKTKCDPQELLSNLEQIITKLGDQQCSPREISDTINQDIQTILDALTLADYQVGALSLLSDLTKSNLIEPPTLLLLLQNGLIFSLNRAAILESEISYGYTVEILLNITSNVPTLLPYIIELMVSSNFTLNLEQKIFFGVESEVEMTLIMYNHILETLLHLHIMTTEQGFQQLKPLIPPVLSSEQSSSNSYSYLGSIYKLTQSDFIASLVSRGLYVSSRGLSLWEPSVKLFTYLLCLALHLATTPQLDKSSIIWVKQLITALETYELDASLVGAIMKLESYQTYPGLQITQFVPIRLEQAKQLQALLLQLKTSLSPTMFR